MRVDMLQESYHRMDKGQKGFWIHPQDESDDHQGEKRETHCQWRILDLII